MGRRGSESRIWVCVPGPENSQKSWRLVQPGIRPSRRRTCAEPLNAMQNQAFLCPLIPSRGSNINQGARADESITVLLHELGKEFMLEREPGIFGNQGNSVFPEEIHPNIDAAAAVALLLLLETDDSLSVIQQNRAVVVHVIGFDQGSLCMSFSAFLIVPPVPSGVCSSEITNRHGPALRV